MSLTSVRTPPPSRPFAPIALAVFVMAAVTGGALGLAQSPDSTLSIDGLLRSGFTYRNLGPFRAGAWVSAIAVPDAPAIAHLYTFYVGVRHGGVWKTTNNGTTFEPLFDSQGVFSTGAVAVAPTDGNIVYVGTGESSNARSSYSGNGVYRSSDGGKTWRHLGLADTHHISQIIVHPSNPDVVFVAAMGHLFSTNAERGVFKTTDGGATWKKVLFVNDRTGAIDLVINRRNPNVLYAAMYECVRRPWRLEDGGPGTGLFKTTDGGANWRQLGGGLPTGTIGRIGIDLYQPDPRILYAVVDNRNARPATEAELRQERERGLPQSPRLIGGEAYRSSDEGQTWQKVSAAGDDLSNKAGYTFNQLRVDTGNPNRLFITGASLMSSEDGGKTWTGLRGPGPRPFRRAFGDFRALWIDPQNPDRIIAASDGGVFLSYDGGRTNDHLANLPLGEIYALTVDMEQPYNIYAGLQDHESWKGPVNGWSGSVGMEDWRTVGIGDGMYNQVDPTDSRWVYNTHEFGDPYRLDQKLHVRTSIAARRPSGQPPLRFNWVTPLRLSPHNPMTVYLGAQVLLRSVDRGDHWQEISPDLTTNDAAKISPPGSSIQFCTITTISESPKMAGVIWIGTDDGKVQVTRNGGGEWTDATSAIVAAGAPQDGWVTRIFASNFDAGTAFVAKTRHRYDDFRAFLYKTTDFGATWTSIAGNLPPRPINVVVEDNTRRELLFVGNDSGVFASIDGGARWSALSGNMPVAPVHDLVVHPREGDLVAGTYGRGIWVTDVMPLRELSEELLKREAHLFAIRPRPRRIEGAFGNYRLYGDRILTTPNEPNGLVFTYYLGARQTGVTLAVTNSRGGVIRTLEGTGNPGLNRVIWDLNGANREAMAPGEYLVTLKAGTATQTQYARIMP